MDDIVLRGMAKWPDVPAVYGWLSLNRRGEWLLKGEKISNPSLVAFIGRNYDHDERGRWFFQNGPQRVYVDLEYTPLVYRVSARLGGSLELVTHAGSVARATKHAWVDEEGAFLVETDIGIGVVHDKDLLAISTALVDDRGSPLSEEEIDARMHSNKVDDQHAVMHLRDSHALVPVMRIEAKSVAARFGFVRCPQDC